MKRVLSRVHYTRKSSKRMITDPCTIYRLGAMTNEYGDEVTGLVKFKDTFCFIEELASRFLFQTPDFSRLTNLRWVIEMAWDEDIRVGDIVELARTKTRFEADGVNRDLTDHVTVKVDLHVLGEKSG